MDVYRQAARIVGEVRQGKGTAKGLCLEKQVQKKKQTYAVVCETLKHYDLLVDVLLQSQFYDFYPQAAGNLKNNDPQSKNYNPLALVLCYDTIIGKGVKTRNDSTARAIVESEKYLREAYLSVYKHHQTIIDENNNNKFEAWDDNNNNNTEKGKELYEFPRYARVNTLKIDTETLTQRLRAAADKKRADNKDSNNNTNKRKNKKVLPPFTLDPIIPDLLLFPPRTDLHAHPAVRQGQLILQDRSSCLPAAVLLGAVDIILPFSKNKKPEPLEFIIDACAAPGNKTTQLSALGNKLFLQNKNKNEEVKTVKIMALERDERRYEVLSRRVALAGASDHVNCVHTDFFDLNSQDRDAAEAILLDPSCSSSGVVTRVDISVNENNNNKRSRDNKNENEDTSFKKNRPVVEETPEEKLLKWQTEHNVTLWEGASTAALSLEDMLLQQEKELKKVQHQFEKESKTKNNNNNENDEIEKIVDEENANPEEEYTPTDDMERVLKLAHLQKKLLTHALLSFQNCKTVVYSTCSIHEEEDELVVLQVLMDERVRERGWQLSHILPKSWESRGREAAYLTEHKSEEVEKIKSDLLSSCENNETNKEEEVKKRKKWFKESLESLKKTIRCDPAKDKTNGFYVARFDRELPS